MGNAVLFSAESQVDAESPLEFAAQTTLRVRLTAVIRFLSKASADSALAVKDVHALRVSTRRSLAALSIYQSLLPPRKAKWFRRELRRIRRAAGDARDLDVFLMRHAKGDRKGSKKLLRWLKKLRTKADRPISGLHRQLILSGRLQRRTEKLLASIAMPDDTNAITLADWGRPRLNQELELCRLAVPAPDAEIEDLHQFRIQIKALRYAVEAFSPLLSEQRLAEVLSTLSALQERLGEINDHATALSLLQQWRRQATSEKVAEQLTKLIKKQRRLVKSSMERFDAQWVAETELRINRMSEILSAS